MTETNCFTFTSCRYETETRTAFLNYGYSSGEEFCEAIHFPGARTAFSPEEKRALERLVNMLHLAAGISYYKAFCPPRILVNTQKISPDEAEFFTKFYLRGLGEFSVENNLDLDGIIAFPVTTTDIPGPEHPPLPQGDVIPIGGGKDSLVSVEILRKAGRPFRPIAVNAGRPILEVIGAADCSDPILISRKIDPGLFLLNKQGAYNGHVPITGILSFIMAMGSILYGYDTVIMSNEQSANEGNMSRDGIEINHQYSKSLEFEQDFSHFISHHVLSGFYYFSLLRPLSETGIALLFSRAPQYFSTFKSCNRNFHIAQGQRHYGWCGDCPKCRFVFLALAPFIGKAGLIRIFGRNLLDDETQERGFRLLSGLEGHKPFECVGEIGECRLLLKSLALLPEWQDSIIISRLAPEIMEQGLSPHDLATASLQKHTGHALPADYERLLDDFIGT